MIWNLMLFVVHFAAAVGLLYLYRQAPCWMQKLVVLGMVISMILITIGYAIRFVGDVWPEMGWFGGLYFLVIGYLFEHIAVLLYVFRLVYKQHDPMLHQEGVQWSRSSAHSPA